MKSHAQPGMRRRVMTAPTVLQAKLVENEVKDVHAQVQTIFRLGNTKIVSLIAISDDTFSAQSSHRNGVVGPWQSHFERTIAIGLFQLYRAPGSVVFLSCGSVLQPILPRSQCWCMDEAGRNFILQIRCPSYWRIELPNLTAAGDEETPSLRRCLESILMLDKTPCPFKESVPVSISHESLATRQTLAQTPLRIYSSQSNLLKRVGNEFTDLPQDMQGEEGKDSSVTQCMPNTAQPAAGSKSDGPIPQSKKELKRRHTCGKQNSSTEDHRKMEQPGIAPKCTANSENQAPTDDVATSDVRIRYSQLNTAHHNKALGKEYEQKQQTPVLDISRHSASVHKEEHDGKIGALANALYGTLVLLIYAIFGTIALAWEAATKSIF